MDFILRPRGLHRNKLAKEQLKTLPLISHTATYKSKKAKWEIPDYYLKIIYFWERHYAKEKEKKRREMCLINNVTENWIWLASHIPGGINMES